MASTRKTDWIWAAAIITLTLALVGWDALSTWMDHRTATEQRFDALARVVETRTGQTFSSIDSMLREVGGEWRPDMPAGDLGYQTYLRTRVRYAPEVAGIAVLALDGTIVQAMDMELVGRNAGRRSYLEHFRADPDDHDLFISEPAQSPFNHTVIFAARAYRDGTGQLKAIIVAALPPSVFNTIVEGACPDEPSGAIALTNGSQIVLARIPQAPAADGMSMANTPMRLAHLASGLPTSIQKGIGGIDGKMRLIAFRNVTPWNMVVAVGAAYDDIIQPVLPHLLADAIILLLVSVLVVGLVRLRQAGESSRRLARDEINQVFDQYLRAFDDMPSLVRRMDTQGKCQYANTTWRSLTGQHSNDSLDDGWLAAVHPDDRAHLNVAGEHDYRLHCADGRQAWIHEVTRPLAAPDGRHVGLLAAGIEITAARQFQDDLQRSNNDLEQFAYVASHDMREPLRLIGGYLGLIERRLGASTDSETKEYLAFARDGATRMDRLIQDLLKYSRIGRMSAEKAMVDLNHPLVQAMASLELMMSEHHAAICVDALPTVFASADDMERLFHNLIANAIQYAQPGVPPRVTITAQRQTGAWRLSVADNGIGVSRGYFERIFGIFQRLHPRDTHGGGSGIGLSICKKIVESHGGRIWVDSPGPNQGSIFSFTLPA